MAAGKEIRGKIKSVENTKKITKAMEMVAACKMRKAQERMRAARPYAEQDPQPGGQPVDGHARVQAPVHAQARRVPSWPASSSSPPTRVCAAA